MQCGHRLRQTADFVGAQRQRGGQVIGGTEREIGPRRGLFADTGAHTFPLRLPEAGFFLRGFALALLARPGLREGLQLGLGGLPVLPFVFAQLQPRRGCGRYCGTGFVQRGGQTCFQFGQFLLARLHSCPQFGLSFLAGRDGLLQQGQLVAGGLQRLRLGVTGLPGAVDRLFALLGGLHLLDKAGQRLLEGFAPDAQTRSLLPVVCTGQRVVLAGADQRDLFSPCGLGVGNLLAILGLLRQPSGLRGAAGGQLGGGVLALRDQRVQR